MSGNREYKSDTFSMLTVIPENALELYNALNGSDYSDPSEVEVCVLDKGISLTVRNDASFVVDANLSIYEHQSTVCPNMPLRSLIYFTSIIEPMIKGKNIYGSRLVKIPTPRFAVFYNGDKAQPEVQELKLSDAFVHAVDEPEIELKVTVYNINKGYNTELLAKCKFLREYMIFVDYVRLYNAQGDFKDFEGAIEKAIDRCIEEGILKDFLIKNRSEVVKVMKLDYSFNRQLELEREDSYEEGVEQGKEIGLEIGLEQGIFAMIADNLDDGRSNDEIIAKIEKRFNTSTERARSYLDRYIAQTKKN